MGIIEPADGIPSKFDGKANIDGGAKYAYVETSGKQTLMEQL